MKREKTDDEKFIDFNTDFQNKIIPLLQEYFMMIGKFKLF